MADNFDSIKSTAQDFRPLFERMDTDADLYNQVEYALPDLRTKKPAKNVVNVTMNDAKVFADRVISFMNQVLMQTVVEGKYLQDRDTTLIENFDSDMRYTIDEALVARDISNLNAFLIEQSCVRGTIAARYASWDNKGKFIPDLLPCDSRYLIYEYDRKDLDMAAFKTTRTESSVKNDYGNINFQSEAGRCGIWEYWNKEVSQIWLTHPQHDNIDGILLDEKPNVFGYVPFIIQGIGAGTMLQDSNSRQYRFESVFAGNRRLFAHLNMLASILQTLNYMTFNRVHLWESEAGTTANSLPEPGVRKTIPIDKGTRGLFPVEISDVNNATRMFYALLLGAVQRGALPNIDYGNLTFPLSAVAISRLTATKDAIFWPRFNAIAWFYRKLHYMIKDQYIKGGYVAELGEEGVERKYSASDLDKDYKINYKFHAVSPEQDIANYAVAAQAKAVGLSDHTVFTNILKLQDPTGEIMKGRAERVEQIDPIVALFRYGHAIIDQATEESFLEAELVADQIDKMLRQRYAPVPEEMSEATGRSKSPQSMMPLLEGGGGGRGAPMNETEMEVAAPEEMLAREERRSETVRKQGQEG